MKKLLRLFLCITLIFSLTSCSDKVGSDEFDRWSEALVEKIMGNENYVLYSLFDDPKSVGIEMDVDGLTITTKKAYEKEIASYKEALKELRTFSYKKLNVDQKITYDVLEEFFTNALNQKDDFYLSTNYFDVNNGVQSSLAINLYFMDIQSEEALQAYLAVMKSCKEMFPQYVQFEIKRQENGYGMSKSYMNEVITQLETFNTQDHSYIVDGYYEKIDEANFLDKEAKTAYKKEVKTIYDKYFIPAYKQLEKDLKQIEIKTKDNDASLCDYEGGKEYYRKLVYETTGFSTVEKFQDFLEEQEDKIIERLIALINKYPDMYDTIKDGSMPKADYTSLENAQDTLKYLEKVVNESGDFPKLENISYQMDIIPEALQDIYKASAAYFVGPFDNLECDEQMILNGSFTQEDYETIAHEGFPGHMYQFRYFKGVEHNILRDILGNDGYSEGWAVYASKQMNAYTNDPATCEYNALNDELVYIYLMYMDIMIHYENATRDEVYAFLRNNFGDLSEDGLSSMYEQTLFDPTIFFPYYGYYFRILDLKEDLKEEWGSKYSEYKFHKAILDLGALSYPLLENYIYELY